MSDYDLINGEILTVTVTVDEETVVANINTAARGPAGASGSGAITGATTSDGTADLSLANVTTATVTITGMSVAPTAAETTSTTQLATTAFVQQELASGVAVAKNLEFLAHNGSGATIAKGSIVYINGAVGGIPRVVKAQANNDTNSARTIAFAKADIANGANGFVISEGELENVSTVDANGIIGAGIQIYLSPTTPGAFTRTKPSAPQHLVYVGVVVTASTGVALDGRILVGIQNGYELDELHDVAISSPAAKQVIKRNAGNTLWVNEAIVSADVSDATSAATANRIVIRDGSGGASLSTVTLSGTGGSPFTSTLTGGVNFANRTLVLPDVSGTLVTAGTLANSATITASTAVAVDTIVLRDGAGKITVSNSDISGTTAYASTAGWTYAGSSASAHRVALGAGTTGSELFGAATAAEARGDIQAPGSVTTGVIGADAISNIISLTAAEYAAIGTKDAATLYVIVG
jgi:hypothetical protein